MGKKYINVTDIRVGDIIASDIINTSGIKLISRNTVINDYIKQKLIELKIEGAYIYGGEGRNLEKFSWEKKKVLKSVDSMKQVLNDLISGKEIDFKKVAEISDDIYSTIDNKESIIKFLNEIRNTDEYTYTHCINVSFYSMMLAKWMKLSEYEIKKAVLSGLLHDVGKTKVPASILNKVGRLEEEEYEEIKRHTQYGYEILITSDEIDMDIKNAVLMHHERMDGSGYPFGAVGDSLNVYTRIVAITDVFDAMTTDRVYRKRTSPFEVFEEFITVGDCIFDAVMLRTLISNIANYYIGTKVLMVSGELGEVAFVPPHDVTKPIIKVNSGYIDTSIGKDKIISIL